jgi:acyl-CoA thioester hydrolase
LRLAGIEHTQLLALDPQLAFVVGHMDVRFLAPAKIDDVLLVETAFTRIQGARLLAEQRISRDGTPIWQAHVTAAVVDLDGRPRRMPKDMAMALQTYGGASFLDA